MEFQFKNSTDAMRGKEILRTAGIRAFVGKRSGEDGCYYYLKISDRNREEAAELLDKHGLLI
ncbi:MAG: hypothetical protein IJN80_03315 [Clostridia bacterium]|nr:hypothetical protein [Clostridia bacterium]